MMVRLRLKLSSGSGPVSVARTSIVVVAFGSCGLIAGVGMSQDVGLGRLAVDGLPVDQCDKWEMSDGNIKKSDDVFCIRFVLSCLAGYIFLVEMSDSDDGDNVVEYFPGWERVVVLFFLAHNLTTTKGP
jgi:hypothetical protein